MNIKRIWARRLIWFGIGILTAGGLLHAHKTMFAPNAAAILANLNPNMKYLLTQATDQNLELGVRTETANCNINAALPDPACTPGAVFSDAVTSTICISGYTATVRYVTTATKKKVYKEYGFSYPQPTGAFETDHLIPLELGGSNEIANLWPEAASPTPGFHEKDMVENYLNEEVCRGNIDLGLAQALDAADWLAIYDSLTPDEIAALKNRWAQN